MELKIHTKGNTNIAELVSDVVVISSVQDALDLMAEAGELEARKIIIYEEQIIPEFFDLRTRLAGEIVQKFTNYYVELAIIGDFSNITSKSLRDFIYESNKIGRILFVASLEEAVEKLVK